MANKNEISEFIKDVPDWSSSQVEIFIKSLKNKFGKQEIYDFVLLTQLSEKKLHFVRHAQSKYNKWRSDSFFHFPCFYHNTLENRDPDITEKGYTQCQTAKTNLNFNPEIIYCSSLSRACQTGLEIFGSNQNYMANELLREMIDTPCDLGSPKSELIQKFPLINFSEVKNEYWWGVDSASKTPYNFSKENLNSVENRFFVFLLQISCRNEKEIAIVSHSLLYRCLYSKFPKFCQAPKNCEIRIMDNKDIGNFLKRVI